MNRKRINKVIASLFNWRLGICLDGKITSYCEVKLIEKNSINFLLNITFRELIDIQVRGKESLFGYKVIDSQWIDFANFLLGNLKDGDLKLINKTKSKYIL